MIQKKYLRNLSQVPTIQKFSEGETKYISNNIEAIYGYSPSDIYKRGKELWLDRIHRDDINNVINSLKKLINDKSSFNIEYRIKHKNGKYIWLRDKADAQMSDDNNGFVMGFFTEITNSKRTKKELVVQKDITQSYLEISSTLIISLNKDCMLQEINNAGCKLIGHKREDILGKHWVRLVTIPEERELWSKAYRDIMNGKMDLTASNENLCIAKNGEIKKVFWNNSLIKDDNGNITGMLCSAIDITEQKLAESMIGKSEEKFKNLLENLNVGVIEHAANTVVRFCNPRSQEILGLTEDQILGKDAIDSQWKFIREDRSEMPLEEYPISLIISKKQELCNYTVGVKHPRENTLTWVIVNGFPVLDANGELRQVVISFIDITKERNIEEQLRNSEKKYRKLFENNPDGILYADSEAKKFVFANPSICKLLGYSKEELIKLSVFDIHPKDDLDFVISEFEAQAKNEKTLAENIPCLKKDGATIYVDINSSTMVIDGKGYSIGYFRDITKRKKNEEKLLKSERKFKQYMQKAPLGVFVADQTGKYLEVNDAASKITGYDREELLQKSIPDLLAKEDLVAGIKNFESLNMTGQSHGEFKFQRKNGEIVQWTVSAVKLSENRFLGYVEDVTSKVADEKEREKMKQQLFHSSKLAAIGELSAGVAHEINNPLAIINGYSGMLSLKLEKLGVNDSELQKFINEQKNGADRIKNIVDGLRVYARMDDDIKESVNVNKITNSSVDLIKNVFEKNDNIIIKQLIQKEELFIHGNKGRFQQIIMNLLSNAKDAMKNINGGVVTIELSGSKKKVVLSISDEGCGIKEGDRDKVFNTFYTTKEEGEGTGMGLSIVESLVKGMDGTIDVESEEGAGTRFIVTIPRFYMEDKKGTIKHEVVDDFKQLNGHVLVVDDEEPLRDILTMFLEMFGLSVEQAENGEIALSKIKTNKYDVVITDLKMPKMSGDQLIKEMAEIGYLSDSKVFVITGGVDKGIFSKDSVLSKLQIGIRDLRLKSKIILQLSTTIAFRLF